jgi:hypothetical protein
MAIPKVGGGYQYTDGNLNEVVLDVVPVPATFTASATLTVAQTINGLIIADKGSDAATTATLPTVADLEATLVNAKVGSAFTFTIVNIASGSSADVTVAVGTGWTLVGLVVIQQATSAGFLARKTGDGAWTLYAL